MLKNREILGWIPACAGITYEKRMQNWQETKITAIIIDKLSIHAI